MDQFRQARPGQGADCDHARPKTTEDLGTRYTLARNSGAESNGMDSHLPDAGVWVRDWNGYPNRVSQVLRGRLKLGMPKIPTGGCNPAHPASSKMLVAQCRLRAGIRKKARV